MARSESSFVNRDSNITYPECFNDSRSGGAVITLKPNSLSTYTATDFYFDIPSIATLQGTTGANAAAAFSNIVGTLNTYKTNNPTLDIKVLKFELLQFASSSFQYIVIVSIFRL